MDLINKRVGGIVVDHEAERQIVGGRSRPFWCVTCDCGNMFVKSQNTIMTAIRNNVYTTCRTCSAKKAANTPKKNQHNLRNHPLYNKYYDIKSRLRRDDNYKHISMCSDWCLSFISFYDWSIINGWKDGLEIDRIDNSKGYEPSNCRYVNRYIQAQNKGMYKTNSLGERNIKKQNNKYIVQVQRYGKRTRDSFDSLEEAIVFRDELLNT